MVRKERLSTRRLRVGSEELIGAVEIKDPTSHEEFPVTRQEQSGRFAIASFPRQRPRPIVTTDAAS